MNKRIRAHCAARCFQKQTRNLLNEFTNGPRRGKHGHKATWLDITARACLDLPNHMSWLSNCIKRQRNKDIRMRYIIWVLCTTFDFVSANWRPLALLSFPPPSQHWTTAHSAPPTSLIWIPTTPYVARVFLSMLAHSPNFVDVDTKFFT